MQSKDYRADIDGLRAIAVLSVLTFHYFESALPGGFFGVDIFFVISGFLLTGRVINSISARNYSFFDFFAKRIRRIFPAFFFVAACCLLFAYVMISPLAFRKFGEELAASAAFFSNFFLNIRVDYFDVGASRRLLLHTWSLSVEEQFYLLLPLFVFASRKNIRVLAVMLSIALVISFGLHVLYFDKYPRATFFLIHTRFWELALGCVTAFLPPPDRLRHRLENVVSAVGLALIAAALLYPFIGLPRNAWLSTFPTFGAAALLWSIGTGWGNRLLSGSVPVFVGKISYPLYLWHWPILVFAKEILGYSLTGPQRALFAMLSIAFATATYWWIETPIREKRVLPTKARIYAFGGGCVLIAVACGMVVSLTNGLPWRLSPKMDDIYAQAAQPVKGQINGAPCRRGPEIPAGACYLGSKSGAPDFVLLGDSHAAPLLAMLDRRAQASDQLGVGLIQFGCMMLPPVDGGLPVLDGCRDTIKSSYDYMKASDVRTIVWVQRWPLYPSATAKLASVQLMTSMRGALAELRDKRVLLFLDVPTLEFSVPDVVARGIGFGFPLPADPSRARWNATSAQFRDEIRTLQSEFPNLEVRDLADAVCDAEICHYWNGRDIFYLDDNHLTQTGAGLAAPLFDSLFEPVRERAEN